MIMFGWSKRQIILLYMMLFRFRFQFKNRCGVLTSRYYEDRSIDQLMPSSFRRRLWRWRGQILFLWVLLRMLL